MQTDNEYFDSDEFKDLLAAYEDSVSSGAPVFLDTDDLVDIADYYTLTGQKNKADQAVETALELDPGATLPLVYKAREALAHEDVEAARQLADAIVDKDDTEYKYLLAEIMIVKDDIDEADDYLKEQEPAHTGDEHEDYIYDIANMYIEYGVYDKANQWLGKTTEPDSPDMLELKGKALMGMGSFEECIKVYDKLIDYDPRSDRYWLEMAKAQYMIHEYNDAITSCEYALALKPKSLAGLQVKANSLFQLGNNEAALEFYTRYTQMAPKDGTGELQIGTTLLHMARYAEALEHLNKAASQSIDMCSGIGSQVYETMALAYSYMGKTEQALECVAKISVDEGNSKESAERLVIHGHVLLEGGHNEEAEAMFRNAIIKSKNSPDIILRVIVSLLDNKNTEMAYNLFKVYFASLEDRTEGYPYMALCCWRLNKSEEFIYYLRQSIKYTPKEASAVMSTIIPKGLSITEFYNDINKFLKK